MFGSRIRLLIACRVIHWSILLVAIASSYYFRPNLSLSIDLSQKKKKTIYLILTILHLLNCILSFPTYSHSIHFLEYYDNNSNNKTIKFMITKKEYKNNYNQIDCTTLLTKYFILSAQHRIAPQRFLKNYYSPHTIPI